MYRASQKRCSSRSRERAFLAFKLKPQSTDKPTSQSEALFPCYPQQTREMISCVQGWGVWGGWECVERKVGLGRHCGPWRGLPDPSPSS